jgi:hypothetical protein
MSYTKEEFQALFPDYKSAEAFSQDPFFRMDNPVQNGTLPVIAKGVQEDEFLVGFTLYVSSMDAEPVLTLIRDVVALYNGHLAGEEPAPEPAPAAPASTATQAVSAPSWGPSQAPPAAPAPAPVAPAAPATPWQG